MQNKLVRRFFAFPRLVRLSFVITLVLLSWLGYRFFRPAASPTSTYQTAVAKRGDLVVSVTGSGSVASSNNVTVSTQATGAVTKVYVQDGNSVTSGQKLADLELDVSGRQAYLSALASYQSAQNSLANAKSTLNSLNSSMWDAHQELMNDAVARSLAPEDPTYIQEHSNWLAAEGKYLTQLEAIKQAQNLLAAASLTLREHAPTLYAPLSGTLSGFSLQPGTVIGATTSSSGSSLGTKLASIVTGAKPSLTVSLTEVDILEVKVSDPATLTFDSQPGKTFTGQVVSVDQVGSVNSGVTSYPVTITLDTEVTGLYPHMTANASIITDIKSNLLLIPSSAVNESSSGSTVTRIVNNQPIITPVTLGATNGTQVEITAGLAEGDIVITATLSAASSSALSSQQSVFSSFGRGGGTRFVGR